VVVQSAAVAVSLVCEDSGLYVTNCSDEKKRTVDGYVLQLKPRSNDSNQTFHLDHVSLLARLPATVTLFACARADRVVRGTRSLFSCCRTSSSRARTA
jgi:hypothetical protein